MEWVTSMPIGKKTIRNASILQDKSILGKNTYKAEILEIDSLKMIYAYVNSSESMYAPWACFQFEDPKEFPKVCF